MSFEEEAAKRITDTVLKNGASIYSKLKDNYTTYNPEIIISCPENIQKYSVVFDLKKGILPTKIRFQQGKPLRVNLRSTRGLVDVSNALSQTEDGFILHTKYLTADDSYMLDVEYYLNTIKGKKNYLDTLVEKNHAKETPNQDDTEYWMHAELKNPKVLKSSLGRLEIRDIDFIVDVGISGDINTAIPQSFKDELKTARNLLTEQDPHKIHKLGMERIQAMKKRGTNVSALESLAELDHMFNPTTFCEYIKVEKEFYFSECLKGSRDSCINPFHLILPKSMHVISRTDLSLDNCASEGIVKYKRKMFIDDIEKIVKDVKKSKKVKKNK